MTPKQKGGEVHIYTSAGPTILVEGGRCKLHNLKLSFFSQHFLDPKKESLWLQNPQNNSSNQQNWDTAKGMRKTRFRELRKYAAKDADLDTLHCLVLQRGGTLVVESCQLSMMFALDERLDGGYSGIVALEGTTLRIAKCEVKSQRMPGLTGISALNADVCIAESRIYDNCRGGVYLCCGEHNVVQVSGCSIYRNKTAGVYIEGYCPKVLLRKYFISPFKIIHRNHIEWNEDGPAIFCDIDTLPKIEGNVLRNNVVGVLCRSASATIVGNRVRKNLQDGVRMQLLDDGGCM